MEPLRLLRGEDDEDHQGGRQEVEEGEGLRGASLPSLTDDKTDAGDETGGEVEVAELEDSPAEQSLRSVSL